MILDKSNEELPCDKVAEVEDENSSFESALKVSDEFCSKLILSEKLSEEKQEEAEKIMKTYAEKIMKTYNVTDALNAIRIKRELKRAMQKFKEITQIKQLKEEGSKEEEIGTTITQISRKQSKKALIVSMEKEEELPSDVVINEEATVSHTPIKHSNEFDLKPGELKELLKKKSEKKNSKNDNKRMRCQVWFDEKSLNHEADKAAWQKNITDWFSTWKKKNEENKLSQIQANKEQQNNVLPEAKGWRPWEDEQKTNDSSAKKTTSIYGNTKTNKKMQKKRPWNLKRFFIGGTLLLGGGLILKYRKQIFANRMLQNIQSIFPSLSKK